MLRCPVILFSGLLSSCICLFICCISVLKNFFFILLVCANLWFVSWQSCVFISLAYNFVCVCVCSSSFFSHLSVSFRVPAFAFSLSHKLILEFSMWCFVLVWVIKINTFFHLLSGLVSAGLVILMNIYRYCVKNIIY